MSGCARAPSTRNKPSLTVAAPGPFPSGHRKLPQPAGNELPENSSATAAPDTTSPSPSCATGRHAPEVPAEKSATDESDPTNAGNTNDNGAAGATGTVTPLPPPSADDTRNQYVAPADKPGNVTRCDVTNAPSPTVESNTPGEIPNDTDESAASSVDHTTVAEPTPGSTTTPETTGATRSSA